MWNIFEIFFKAVLTIVLCSVIGAEREIRDKGAGLKTHILVGVGSALIVMTSFHILDVYKNETFIDPSRMIAAIVQGVGFLCAGTIIRAGTSVRGLTTAATLWIVSGIGIATGAGYYLGAVIFTGIVFLVLIGLRSVEHRLKEKMD